MPSTSTSNSAVLFIARVFISILFILAGWEKLTTLSSTAGYFATLHIPMPSASALIAGLVEFFGGLLILVGYQTRIAALVLALFTLSATLIAHMDFSQPMNVLMTQKNLAIAGGLLALYVMGAGNMSVDNRITKTIK